jgi:thioredoxin reductase (NADPH)
MRRFGNLRSFAAGESLWTVGQVAPGLMVILAGKVAVTERDQFDNHKPIAVHGPGNFLGELELLSGRAALVDANAQEPLEALIIPSERLRALMIAEAELGERNMRALIWRRVAILEAGSPPNCLAEWTRRMLK